jgi:nucleotide-binding universal stress UspA family protein
MLRRILLPLERCDDEAGAVEFARTLACRRPLELLLLRVEELPLLGPFAAGFALASRACDLAGVRSRLDQQEGLRTTVLLSEAVSAGMVAEHARRRAASMILLPYHRESAWMRMISGCAADRILRESPVPVLAVPGPAVSVTRVLYAYEEAESAFSGLRHAIDLAQLFEAQIRLLRVQGPPRPSDTGFPVEERLLSILRRREVAARVLPSTGDAASDVAAAVARDGIDLMVLSGSPETERACLSLARRVLQTAAIPLLVTREPAVPSRLLGAPLRVGI